MSEAVPEINLHSPAGSASSPVVSTASGRPAAAGHARLQAYGIQLGVQLMARGKLKRGLRYIVVPVNYWRSLEYGLVLDRASFGVGDRVLDIGSPKLLSLYIAEKTGAAVTATDIDDYFVSEYDLLRQLREISAQSLRLGVADGRRLSYPNQSFDKVYSISVVEHIPDRGDTDCVREIARVLAPGGLCVLTVPFWPTSRIDWREADFYWSHSSDAVPGGKVFFQRRYSNEDLYDRLVRPSGLRLIELSYVGERVMAGSRREFCEFLPPITGPVQPFLARRLLTDPVADWRGLRKPLCALIVLEKPYAFAS
jgi:SAM-dependent methyltransferase